MSRTLALHDELCAAGKCTKAMHAAFVEYRAALTQMQKSIEKAQDEKELGTLTWLYEQWDQQGAQRMAREAMQEGSV